MIGVVLILLVLFVIGPIAIFFGGGIWSALTGFFATEDAEGRVPGASADASTQESDRQESASE